MYSITLYFVQRKQKKGEALTKLLGSYSLTPTSADQCKTIYGANLFSSETKQDKTAIIYY